MKRTILMIAATALACTVGATGVWAARADRSAMQHRSTTAQCLSTNGLCADHTGLHYPDADGDGVCDWCASGDCRYDADGDGVCDYAGQGRGDLNAGGKHGGGHHSGWGC